MSLSRRLVGVGFVVAGLLMLAAPGTLYGLPSYRVALDLCPRWCWALAFIASGLVLVTLRRRRDLALAAGVLVLGSWTCCLWASVLLGRAPWAGPVWPSLVVGLMVINSGHAAAR